MSFIYTIYKRFKGSGISEVLVATGVISDGSVDQALRGKHFKRGVRCLRLFYETLIHHALDKRLEGSSLSEEVKVSLLSWDNQTDAQELADVHAELEKNAEVKELIDTLLKDFEGVALAEYWVILTQNIHSLRTSNWTEFKSSLKLMLPWMTKTSRPTAGDTDVTFQISLQCSIPFLLNRLHLQKIVCLRSQWQEIHVLVCCPWHMDWIDNEQVSKPKSSWLAILNNEKQLIQYSECE